MSTFDENITPVLQLSSNEELEPLIKYIMEANISETLSNNDLYKRFQPNHQEYTDLILVK